MKVWLATAPGDRFFDAMAAGHHKHYLGAYPITNRTLTMLTPQQFCFFLDSGAYSAWTRGAQIDIDEYIAFIRCNIEHIEVYASLDVIPGRPGRASTEAQRHQAAEQSWANYLYMVRDGLDPIPVFHYGEDFKYLERMLAFGCTYIGIGGLVSVTGPNRMSWLDRVFARLTDAGGHPLVRTHGFGMTSIPLIFRYPWFSVDSTTWIQVTANGAVYLPAMVDGEFVFDRAPSLVSVSHTNTNQKTGGKAANSMSPAMRTILDKWLAFCGETYAGVSTHYYHRAVVNVTFFREVSARKTQHPFQTQSARRVAMV
jgi:hypothetical protein